MGVHLSLPPFLFPCAKKESIPHKVIAPILKLNVSPVCADKILLCVLVSKSVRSRTAHELTKHSVIKVEGLIFDQPQSCWNVIIANEHFTHKYPNALIIHR